MRQFFWSPKPTNRERQTNLPLKTRTTRSLSRLTRTNSKLTRTNSNLTRTNSKPNPIQNRSLEQQTTQPKEYLL